MTRSSNTRDSAVRHLSVRADTRCVLTQIPGYHPKMIGFSEKSGTARETTSIGEILTCVESSSNFAKFRQIASFSFFQFHNRF